MPEAANTLKRLVLRIPILRQLARRVRARVLDWALRVHAAEAPPPPTEDAMLEIYRLRSALHRAIGEAARERDCRLALEASITDTGAPSVAESAN